LGRGGKKGEGLVLGALGRGGNGEGLNVHAMGARGSLRANNDSPEVIEI